MIIAYDVSHVRKQRAGIGRLALTHLRGLLAADAKREYILHGWGTDLDVETLQSFTQPNVRLAIADVPGAVKRIYWNYFRPPSRY